MFLNNLFPSLYQREDGREALEKLCPSLYQREDGRDFRLAFWKQNKCDAFKQSCVYLKSNEKYHLDDLIIILPGNPPSPL